MTLKIEPLPSPSVPDAPGSLPLPEQALARIASSRRRMILFIVFVLLAAGWGAYAPVTGYDFVPLDDPGYVYENPALQHGLSLQGVRWAFTTTVCSNWHPLTWLSLLADYQFYGLNPGGYHLTNLLLHEAATVLLFCWLVLATRRLWASAGVAMLFCIHPAHVESVAWITERKDVLSAVFFVLVLLAYTGWVRTRQRRYYLAALAALVLGLLAKPMLVTVPPLLLLLDAWPLGRVGRPRDLVALAWEKLPFALVAVASCVATFAAQHQGGATVALEALPVSWRLGNSVTACVAYVGELLWPAGLGVFYPYSTHLAAGRAAACALGLAAATFLAVRLYRSRPYALIGWLWFLGTLVPVIGLVQVGNQAMADRYTYLPSIGLFIVLCWAVEDCWQRLPRLRPALAVAGAGALAACLALCVRQVGYWQDGVTLSEHTVAVTRPTPRMELVLGDAWARRHRYAEAEAAYGSVLKTRPGNAEILTKLGYLQLAQDHWEPACQLLRPVSERSTCSDPILYNNLGLALTRLGRLDEAAAAIRHSLQLRPGYADAHNRLAAVLMAKGEAAPAAAEYETALSMDLQDPASMSRLAWLYSFADQTPTQARAERALLLARQAVNLPGGRTIAGLDSLAAAQAANGDWTGAAGSAQASLLAIAGQPEFPESATAIHRARLAAYRSGAWPER